MLPLGKLCLVLRAASGDCRSANFEICEISFAQIFAVHQILKSDLAEIRAKVLWNELLKLNKSSGIRSENLFVENNFTLMCLFVNLAWVFRREAHFVCVTANLYKLIVFTLHFKIIINSITI